MTFEEKYKKLCEPFDTIKERDGHAGNTYKYIPITEIIKRLNSVFGLKWNFQILREEMHYDNEKSAGVKESTTVTNTEMPVMELIEVPQEDENAKPKTELREGKTDVLETVYKSDTYSKEKLKYVTALCRLSVIDDEGQTWTKESWGGQEVKYLQNSANMVNISNDKKGAVSDALKKCSELLGIALDLDAASEPSQHSEIISLFKQLGVAKIPDNEMLTSMSYDDAFRLVRQLNFKIKENT